MTKKSTMGRPKSKLPTRTRNVGFFLTPDDAQWLTEFASSYGFKSRSELITAMVERSITCGFSPIGMFRIGSQMQSHCSSYNPERYNQCSLDFNAIMPRPYPALPDSFIDPKKVESDIDKITQEFRNERKPT